MNTKGPTSAATLAEAAAEMTAYRASIPISDCTTTTTGRQRKVSDFLNHGQENAVPLRQLMAITGADGRSIREKIAAERLAGAYSVGQCDGVLLAGERGGSGEICPQYAA